MQAEKLFNHRVPQSLSQSRTEGTLKAEKMVENYITTKILGCAFKIHTHLGPGLLESSYEECLFYELQKAGLKVEKQKALPLHYKDVKLDIGYKVDLLVEDKVIIELKTVEEFNDVHLAQTLTYLKLSGCKVGLLINFNVKSLKQGIKRVINTPRNSALHSAFSAVK